PGRRRPDHRRASGGELLRRREGAPAYGVRRRAPDEVEDRRLRRPPVGSAAARARRRRVHGQPLAGAGAGGPRARRPDPALVTGQMRRSALRAAAARAPAVFLLLVAATVALQWLGGAYTAEYGSAPDEAAHYVTGLMVHGYLADGLPGD